MATIILPFASFGNGQVRAELDVNDANWKVLRIRCINDSPFPLAVRVLKAGAPVFEDIAPAWVTTSWNVGGVNLGWQDDYWNSDTETWEAGGIEMGDYVLQAQWPAEA